MDVLSLDLLRSAPPFGGPRSTGRASDGARRSLEALLRLAGLRGTGAPADDPQLAASDAARRTLLGWTAAQIAAGLGLLVWATAAVPIHGSIDPRLDGTALAGPAGGVLLWTLFGLLGSVRPISNRGNHFTFNLPFVGAAMVLGGPTAGAWVAFLSTVERRELESLPWYAIAANHATMVVAAIAGGATVAGTDALLGGVTGDGRLAQFGAIVVGGIVLELVANGLAAATVMLRDRMSRRAVVAMLVEDFGRVTVVEIGLVWVLAIAFVQVGWWAPLIVGGIVLVLADPRVPDAPDPLTGLLRKPAFERRLDRKVGWMRRGVIDGGTVMYLDLNGFHLVNNQHGHDVGDEALRVVGERLRAACPRHEDLVSRLMGDEFALHFAGMTSADAAVAKAEAILDAICRPVPTSVGPVRVGVAVGVVVSRAWGGVPSGVTLLRWAEQAMYHAKRNGDPCGGVHVYSPDDASPWDGAPPDDRREDDRAAADR